MRALRNAVSQVIGVSWVMLQLAAWFGYMRRGGWVVHHDDHRWMAKQAVRYLLREGKISDSSGLAASRETVERSCGLLDVMETEIGGRVPGKLKWECSHMYDPIAGRGAGDGHLVNALEEFSDFWNRSLIHFRIGSRAKAYRFLGYCCHLLQDMAVPSHTFCVPHGLRTRTADNLELLSRSRRFYLREPVGPPYPGDEDAHIDLLVAMGTESRGREAFDPDEENEIAGVLEKYYVTPEWTDKGWYGGYVGESYYPYHRLLPSTPHITYVDLVTIRNFLMERAASRTAQLIVHFASITGAGNDGTGSEVER